MKLFLELISLGWEVKNSENFIKVREYEGCLRY